MHRKRKTPWYFFAIYVAAFAISGLLATRSFIPSDWKLIVFFLTTAILSFAGVTAAAFFKKRR